MTDYPPLNLPPFDIKVRTTPEGRDVFDPLRRRWVRLTPEEWVRQHFCNYLVHHRGYPATSLGNEVGVNVGGVSRRCDTLLYRREGATPRMIVEYKAPSIPITESVFTQIQSYNSVLRADYLVVSNGLQTFCLHMDYIAQQATFLPEVPAYTDLR